MVILAVAGLVPIPGVAQETGTWVDHAPMPTARQEVGAAAIGGAIYVVGGLVAAAPTRNTNVVEAYEIATDTWVPVAPLPVGLDHMGVAALNGLLYVGGGLERNIHGGAIHSDALYIYDPALDAWTEGPPLPEGRGAPWMVTHKGKLYVVGGTAAGLGARTAVLVYDPATQSWATGADMPTAREHLNAVSAGDYIYVIGGRASGTSFTANERYHPETDSWETMAAMPTARAAMAMAAYGARIYCMGGETPQLYDLNEIYHIPTNTWRTGTPMALPRHGIAAVRLPRSLFMPGGGIVQGLDATAAADSFVPDVSAADLDGDGAANAVDLALVINAVLGVDVAGRNVDATGDGGIDAVDVQFVINEILGG